MKLLLLFDNNYKAYQIRRFLNDGGIIKEHG